MTDEITLDAPETRLERFLAAAAGVEGITLDDPVTRIEKYLYKIAQGSGGVPAVEDADKGKYLHANESTGAVEWADAPDELPAVSAVDAGKVLAVNNSGVWGASEPIGKKFIVTLTPTALDYSGTMDKTVSEIDAAYKAGREIWFNVITSEQGNACVQLESVGFHEDYDYPSFNLTGVLNNVLFFGFTGTTNDGTKATYSTGLYTITPAT